MEAFPPLACQCLAAAVCIADASAAFVVLVLVEAILFVALLAWWWVFLVGHPAGKTRGLLSIFVPPSRYCWGTASVLLLVRLWHHVLTRTCI